MGGGDTSRPAQPGSGLASKRDDVAASGCQVGDARAFRSPRPVRRRRLLFVLAGALAWGLEWHTGGEDPSLSRLQASGRLRVGLDPSYPPLENVDADGRLDGFDVDLAHELARRLGVKPEFVSLDAGGLFDAVVARRCDVAIGVPPIREFLKDLRYSRPYLNAGQVLVVRAGLVKAFGPELVVGVETGSGADLHSGALARRLGGPDLRRLASLEALQTALRSGQLDGVLVDAVAGHELVKSHPDLALGTEPLTTEPYVIAVHKHDARLLSEINSVLDVLESEGYLERLADKWLR